MKNASEQILFTQSEIFDKYSNLNKYIHAHIFFLSTESNDYVSGSRHDIAEQIVLLGLSNNHSLTIYCFSYITVLHQFEAVSFGDSLFGCYILIPLQQKHGLELRRSIWTEQRGILRTLYLPVREVCMDYS